MELGKADEQRLIQDRKLVLLVDLDQTLIHTTNDNVPPNLKVRLRQTQRFMSCLEDKNSHS